MGGALSPQNGENRGRTPLFLLAALVLGLAGCGISAEPAAHRVDADQVPFDLVVETTTSTEGRSGEAVTVFLWSDHLVAVERSVPDNRDLEGIVTALASGPTDDESATGLSSSLPSDEVNGVDSSRGVATVDLAPTFADLRSADQLIAIAQLVYTLTARPGIGRVRFTLDGHPVEVPRGDGSLTSVALAREDFDQLAAPG